MPYELRTFGGLELLGPDGERIEGVQAHSKRSALLAYLAARPEGRPAPREEVAPLLWPERPGEQARNALRVALSRLRDVLPAGALGGKGRDRLWLDGETVDADVRAFRRAVDACRDRDALEIYRGPFLEHVHLTDAGPFNRWADERRGAYRRRAYEAALSLGAESREEGALPEAEAAYRRALDLAPLKEDAAAGLMRVLSQQGDRADAVALYEEFADRLERELELSPSAELEELADRIRAGPRREADGEGGAGTGPPERSPGRPAPGSGEPDGRGEAAGTGPLRLAAGLLLVALAAAGAWLAWEGAGGDRRGGTEAAAAARPPAVAVLPFDGPGADAGAEPFLRGLHVGVLTRLSKVSGLAVLSREAVLPYRGSELPLAAIADSLRAQWILRADVQTSGERVRVHARLVDPQAGTQRWAETYRGKLEARSLFEIQARVAERIARAVEVELGPAAERRVAAVPTESTGAYELYLLAEEAGEGVPNSPGRARRRIRLYRRAVGLDSSFARAWSGLADAYVDLSWSEGRVPRWADSGLAVARRALRIDSALAHAHVQRGDALGVLAGREEQAEAYRRALELDPGNRAAANNLGALLGARGELAEKLKWLGRIRRARPAATDALSTLVLTNAWLGRDSVARAWRAHARERDVSLAGVDFTVSLFWRQELGRARQLLARLSAEEDSIFVARRRAAIALYAGDWAEARRRYRPLYSGPVGTSSPIFRGLLEDRLGLAWALDRLGQQSEAREIARGVRESSARDVEGSPLWAPRTRLAVAHLLLGDTAEALAWLERSVDAGFRDRRTLEAVPTVAPLRDHPRFRDLLDRIGRLLAEERRRAEAEGWGEPPG